MLIGVTIFILLTPLFGLKIVLLFKGPLFISAAFFIKT